MRGAEPGLAAWERGLLVHDAMEHVWRRLEGSDALRRSADEELSHVIREGVDHAIETLIEKRREPLPPRFEQVERGRLHELVFAWLQVEKADRGDAFRAIQFEFKRTVEIRGVTAEVRIDRVDQLEDGRQIILDYKTGATKSKEWDHKRPIEPQLPLYAVSHDAALGGALFARLRAMDSGFQGAVAPGISIRGSEEKRADRFDERIAQWRRNLEVLAEEFLAGRAVVEPRDGKCRYCELPALCRKNDAV
jgi:RecB family exonuclease